MTITRAIKGQVMVGDNVRRIDGSYFDGTYGHNRGFLEAMTRTRHGLLAQVRVGHNQHEVQAVHAEYLEAFLDKETP